MNIQSTNRLEFAPFQNGEKANLPFSGAEYDRRLAGLRQIMAAKGIHATILTSMHNIAYYSGFLYCSFGRPYACVVTADTAVTISAGIDGGQPARQSACDNLVYGLAARQLLARHFIPYGYGKSDWL